MVYLQIKRFFCFFQRFSLFMDENVKKVLARLQAQCSKREYCSKDILAKAVKLLEGDADAASEVLASLVEEKYVSDLRYASAFAREKSSIQGWGKVKIAYMLSAKGISRDTINEAFEDIDDDSASRKLENVIRVKYRLLADDPQCKIKLLRFALSRGYSYDEVRSVVDKVMTDGGNI